MLDSRPTAQPLARDRLGAATHAEAITPSDDTEYTPAMRAVFVGTGGDLAVVLAADATARVFKNVPNGQWLALAATKVMSTNTTAQDVVGLW